MAEAKHTMEELRQWQALPLSVKLLMTKERIRQWVNEFGEDGVCVSFSGGKDSTVLLHIVRSMYPNVKAVFSNTGLEYPEIQKFVRGFDNAETIRPEKSFRDVILECGYPLIGKEVAEAIYYARRLRGGWKVNENGENCSDNGASSQGTIGYQTEHKRKEMGGGKNHFIKTSGARNRRTILQGAMPRQTAEDRTAKGSEMGGVSEKMPQPKPKRSTRQGEFLESEHEESSPG